CYSYSRSNVAPPRVLNASSIAETIDELDAAIGTWGVGARLPLTRLPYLVSTALHRATADVDVVRVNDCPAAPALRASNRVVRRYLWLRCRSKPRQAGCW